MKTVLIFLIIIHILRYFPLTNVEKCVVSFYYGTSRNDEKTIDIEQFSHSQYVIHKTLQLSLGKDFFYFQLSPSPIFSLLQIIVNNLSFVILIMKVSTVSCS